MQAIIDDIKALLQPDSHRHSSWTGEKIMAETLPCITHTYQNHALDSTRWHCYQPRSDDVIITTSLKSGTTWMQEIVGQLIFLGHDSPEGGQKPRGRSSIWFEPVWSPLDEQIGELESQQHRRFIKSHLPLDGLPFFPQVQYIVVGRDARDVFMSLWNHHGNYTPGFLEMLNSLPGRAGDPMPTCPQDIHEFWHDWVTRGWFEWESEGYPYWGNMHHTHTWWEYRHLPNILFVHYNDLLADLAGEIQRIADFLTIPLVNDALSQITQAVTFDAMRDRAVEAEDPNRSSAFKEGVKTFFFKGTNGRWKDVLSADELTLYDRKAASVLAPDSRAWLEQGRTALE
jgi:aryl sulfotransferase